MRSSSGLKPLHATSRRTNRLVGARVRAPTLPLRVTAPPDPL